MKRQFHKFHYRKFLKEFLLGKSVLYKKLHFNLISMNMLCGFVQ